MIFGDKDILKNILKISLSSYGSLSYSDLKELPEDELVMIFKTVEKMSNG